jgi:hypothetical protein
MFLGREQRLVSKCGASGVDFSFLGSKIKCSNVWLFGVGRIILKEILKKHVAEWEVA